MLLEAEEEEEDWLRLQKWLIYAVDKKMQSVYLMLERSVKVKVIHLRLSLL